MKVLCGSDFTSSAGAAVEVAGAIAASRRGTMRLVHVVDRGDDAEGSLASKGADESLKERLRDQASRVASTGVSPETALLRGHPDEAITAEAGHLGIDLIVVGALGRRERPRWRLGSTADRIAQHAPCPVLVVRDAKPFSSWTRSERPLRVVVGIESTATCEALLIELAEFTSAGSCTLIGAHVYWPPEARERLHLSGPIPIGKGNREVDAAIERELRDRIGSAAGGAPMSLRIVGGLGRVADHLVQIAEEESADLIAVGSHQRSGFERWWHGSTTHGVIDSASISVLCVPTS